MAPWSNDNKTGKIAFFLAVLSFLIVVLFFEIAKKIGGIHIMFSCLKYAYEVIVHFYILGVDYKAVFIGLFTAIYCLVWIAFFVFVLFYQKPKQYGDAHFANKDDLKKMGLLDETKASGIIVGKYKDKYLSPPFLRHGIALAPTRSGKTAGFVIPSALSFKGSLILTDPKGELEGMLANGFKKRGYNVYSIDWSNEHSKHAWNPLSLSVFPSPHEKFPEAERQAERISAMLVGGNGKEDHWEAGAKKHIAALILLSVWLAECALDALEKGKRGAKEDYDTYAEPHMSKVFHFVSKNIDVSKLKEKKGLKTAKDNLRDLLNFAANVEAPERILNDIGSWINTPDDEAGSHMSTFISKTQIWRSAAVKGATRCCSFDWKTLRKKKSVVFLKFPQRDAQSLGVLTALFFETFFGWALDTPKQPGELDIAILADEFASLPKINLMTDFLSKGAGMGAVIWLILQDFSQVREIYGDKQFDTIKTNCSYLLTYAQNNFNTQRELASMAGKKTQKRIGESESSKGGKSYSYNDEGADLMPVSDWGSIPFGNHILMVQGFMTRPIYCETPLYYKDQKFLNLLEGENICQKHAIHVKYLKLLTTKLKCLAKRFSTLLHLT